MGDDVIRRGPQDAGRLLEEFSVEFRLA